MHINSILLLIGGIYHTACLDINVTLVTKMTHQFNVLERCIEKKQI